MRSDMPRQLLGAQPVHEQRKVRTVLFDRTQRKQDNRTGVARDPLGLLVCALGQLDHVASVWARIERGRPGIICRAGVAAGLPVEEMRRYYLSAGCCSRAPRSPAFDRRHAMTDQGAGATTTTLELAHTMMSEAEALTFLAGQRISLGAGTMDPKAQIVGEFVKSIRVPGYFPPLPELRQQLRTMVTLMDEPAPSLPRIENISIPGPAGPIPARVYDPVGNRGAARPVLAYFHGGGWVQGDLETHH